jgi:hypothetical protein
LKKLKIGQKCNFAAKFQPNQGMYGLTNSYLGHFHGFSKKIFKKIVRADFSQSQKTSFFSQKW